MANKNNRLFPLATAIALNLLMASPANANSWGADTAYPIAVLQGLDKITARISTLIVPIDHVTRFGSLWITARACHKKPPEEAPEAAAFLEIDQQNPNEPRLALMRGWVFASSRGLNALEHPVYDVWLVDCKKAPTSDQAPSSGKFSGKNLAGLEIAASNRRR